MTEPAGLYLHVPFCSAICPYCDFAVRRGDRERAGAFIETLLREIDDVASGRRLPEAAQLQDAVGELASQGFDSIYLGGGTPSLLPADALERLLDRLRERFALAPETRIFFEANPEHVTAERARAWRRLGVGTLSLGVQALDAGALRFLGRAHSPDEARRAVALARDAGFDTVSIDLIYGLPEEATESPDPSLDAWRRQLEGALALEIDHLSLYELEIHAATPFGTRARRGELVPLDEDRRSALFVTTHHHLEGAGFTAYEVSNFARGPEHRSRHNQKYWRHVPYLGLGPSAHSFARGRHGTWRFWNEKLEPHWRRLVEGELSPAAGWERLGPSALALEASMLGLRTRDGLDLDHARSLSGLDLWPRNEARLRGWAARGWIEIDGRRLHPTPEGMARADRLAAELEL